MMPIFQAIGIGINSLTKIANVTTSQQTVSVTPTPLPNPISSMAPSQALTPRASSAPVKVESKPTPAQTLEPTILPSPAQTATAKKPQVRQNQHPS
jgi:hypothetical protein